MKRKVLVSLAIVYWMVMFVGIMMGASDILSCLGASIIATAIFVVFEFIIVFVWKMCAITWNLIKIGYLKW
ncbi:MAG: hypothetical protein Q4B26_05425 [Eubacteriales bacterium]|nr:hypothetical protein [Eubacteriales bacterium]